ncbi:MAG: DUF4838 domain-containing protein [Phycisphaerae bacterium]|nr:DUF4838 domain-containing protein [Phycisphaerae bacterium]
MRSMLLSATLTLIAVASRASALDQGVDVASLSGWDIVVASDAIPSERYAAEELHRILAEATGERLELVQKVSRADNHIFVGPSEPMRTSPGGFDVKGFDSEDLRIVIRAGHIVIAGGRPRGTLYGVYTFLEDYLGVRFLTKDHTHVPKVGGWRVVGPVDRFYHPPLAFRWSDWRENSENPPFATRLRYNAVTNDAKYGGKTGLVLINHSLGRQIPSSKYGKEHPEYYALVNGKRLADVKNDFMETQPCLTNPEVLRIVTDAVLAELKQNPNAQNISISQNDNDRYCRCPRCAALDEHEGTPMGSLLTFVNAVADEVAKPYPQVKVGTLSYWYSRKPPRTLKPRPNVQIQLCSIECCQLHAINDAACPKNLDFCRDMDGWGRICSNVSVWNYDVNFSSYQLPLPNLPVIEPNIRYFLAHQAKGVFLEAAAETKSAALVDLHNYVMSRLLWDPSGNGDALADEFLRLHYRRAADPIRRFIHQVEQQSRASGQHPSCFGSAAEFGFDEKLAQAGLDAFGQAMRLTDDEAVRSRVEKASVCAYRLAIEPVWKLDEKVGVSPELAERMRPLVREFFLLCTKYQITFVDINVPTEQVRDRLKKLLWRDTPPDF